MSPQEPLFPLKWSEPGRLGEGCQCGGLHAAALGVGCTRSFQSSYLHVWGSCIWLHVCICVCTPVHTEPPVPTDPPVPRRIPYWEWVGPMSVAAEAAVPPCVMWGLPVGGVSPGPSPGRLRSCLKNAEALRTTEAPLSTPRLPVPPLPFNPLEWGAPKGPEGSGSVRAVSRCPPSLLSHPRCPKAGRSEQPAPLVGQRLSWTPLHLLGTLPHPACLLSFLLSSGVLETGP